MISISLLAATPLSPPTARDLAGFRDAGHALAWLASDVWHGRLLELQTVEDGYNSGRTYYLQAVSEEDCKTICESIARYARRARQCPGPSCRRNAVHPGFESCRRSDSRYSKSSSHAVHSCGSSGTFV